MTSPRPELAAALTPQKIRIAAMIVAVVLIGTAFISGQTFLLLLLFGPALLGCVPPAMGSPELNRQVDSLRPRLGRIKGRGQLSSGKFGRYCLRPLGSASVWLWSRTETVVQDDLRAGLRLACICYLWLGVAALLGTALYVIITVVVAILMLLVAFLVAGWILKTFVFDGAGPGWSVPSSSGGSWKTKLAGTRIVSEGFFTDAPSGMKVNEHGQLVREGWFADSPTGMKIDDEGRVVREGLISDPPTGVKINTSGQIVHEGHVVDTATGFKFNDEGQVVKEGFIFDQPTGTKFKRDS